MRAGTVGVVLILVILAAPSFSAETGSYAERHIARLIATPTPVGAFNYLSDQGTYRVDLPAGAIGIVEARTHPGALLTLRAHQVGSPEPGIAFASSHQIILLPHGGAWRVLVDPAAGVPIDIAITFRGRYADLEGVPASFTLTDLGVDRPCVLPGVCLP